MVPANAGEGETAMREDQRVSLVVVTALPVEQAAVKQVLDRVDAELDGFVFGSISGADGVVAHRLAVGILPQAGNSTAASAASEWAARFFNAQYLVMVGIAGGIPSPENLERHVRLGDVVVPDGTGVREHDRGKVKDGAFEPIFGGTPAPASQFVSISRQLIGGAIVGEHPWQDVLDERFQATIWKRPGADTDVIAGTDDDVETTPHPDPDQYRTAGIPRLLSGLIASGNLVVKDRDKRIELARLGALAIEMEGAGVASSAWVSEREYFAVRGVVDYADGTKSNVWHNYGSAAAAAVLRAILDRKSPTVDEAPAPVHVIDGVQAGYVTDIRAAIAAAIVEAQNSRIPVIDVVQRWQTAHDTLNGRPLGHYSGTGEPVAMYIPRQQADSFTDEALAELTAARSGVEAHTTTAATTVDLLVDVTDNSIAVGWLEALKRALDDLVVASGTWPAAPSGNKHEPPPGDDNGALTASIQNVRSTLGAALRSLAGTDMNPAPEPEPIAQEEPSEVSQRVQYLDDLADRLAAYARVTSKPFVTEDHDAAIAAAAEVLDIPDTVLLQAGLSEFAGLAARVARNATRDEWTALIERAAQLEPLLHAVEVLLAYSDFHEQNGDLEFSGLARAAATDRLEELPERIEGDEFWASTTGENVRRLSRLWASADDRHDVPELLGSLAQGSETGLCRVLEVLASTVERTNTFTDEVRLVREVHDRFGWMASLVHPSDIRAAIVDFVPRASSLDEWDVADEPECVRFAVQFLAACPT